MSIALQAPAYIRAISPYIPGKPITELARQMGIPVEKIVKLASNENPLGMSPKARKAVETALAGVERYPDQFELIAALAERHGVSPGQITLGNGSNDVLDLAARVFLAPGRSAVFSKHAFAVYPLATMSAGAECIAAAAKNYGHDPEAMLAAIRPDTHMVWIANPNNPTGNFLPQTEVRAFIGKIPAHVAVVLDEAYTEYLAPADRAEALAIQTETAARDPRNIVVQFDLSNDYQSLGVIHYTTGHYTEARAALRRSREIADAALKVSPGQRSRLYDYAGILAWLGKTEVKLGRSQDGIDLLRHAVAITTGKDVDTRKPADRHEYQQALGDALAEVANRTGSADTRREAREAWQAGLDGFRRLQAAGELPSSYVPRITLLEQSLGR